MAVISKKRALEALNSNGYLHWDSLCARCIVYDKDGKWLGTLRYDTYRKLSNLVEWGDYFDVRCPGPSLQCRAARSGFAPL